MVKDVVVFKKHKKQVIFLRDNNTPLLSFFIIREEKCAANGRDPFEWGMWSFCSSRQARRLNIFIHQDLLYGALLPWKQEEGKTHMK